MKKAFLITTALMVPCLILMAQEKVKVDVKVTEKGKVTSEKSFEFKDAEAAEQALKTLDLMSDDEGNVIVKVKKMEGKDKKMVFISEDGEVKELKGEVKWIKEPPAKDGQTVKVMKMKKKVDEEGDEEEMVEVKTEVIVLSGDEDEEWTIKEMGDQENTEVIVIKKKKSDDGELKVEVEVEQEKPPKKEKVKSKK